MQSPTSNSAAVDGHFDGNRPNATLFSSRTGGGDPSASVVATKRRIGDQFGIDEASLAPLDDLAAGQESIERGAVLQEEGDLQPYAYFVDEGWLLGTYVNANGGRSVTELALPGDIIGSKDVNWTHATTTISAATPAKVTKVAKKALFRLFTDAPEIAWCIHAITAKDAIWQMDQHRVNTRFDAAARLAFFFLQTHARQHFQPGWQTDRCFCPLTQRDIADTVGITDVSVNRSLRELREMGWLTRDGSEYMFDNARELMRACEFVNRYPSVTPFDSDDAINGELLVAY